MRMKTAAIVHVQNASGTMFGDATDAVQRELDQMCRQIRDVIDEQVELVYTRVSRRLPCGTRRDRCLPT